MQEINRNTRYNSLLSGEAKVFSEFNYAPFDTDAVRPALVEIAGELIDTAIVHES